MDVGLKNKKIAGIPKDASETATVIIGETPRPKTSKPTSKKKANSNILEDEETVVLSEKLGIILRIQTL